MTARVYYNLEYSLPRPLTDIYGDLCWHVGRTTEGECEDLLNLCMQALEDLISAEDEERGTREKEKIRGTVQEIKAGMILACRKEMKS